MLTGWYPHFSLHKGLCPQEVHGKLDIESPGTFIPDDALGLIACNSTYIEFVNRTFKVKGMAATLMSVCFMVAAISVGIWTVHALLRSLADDHVLTALMVVVITTCSCGPCAFLWFIHLRKDLFQYTHYPVRFNRITRKIYFFRHNGPGGVVVVPWGSPFAFFHIGRGGQDPNLRDLRCHLLDRNRQVQQTFTIGHFWDHDQDIREEWALICRYMQDGPEACFDDPLDRVITLSTLPTLRNHWMLVCLMMGTNLFPLRHNLFFPFYGALTLSRWLTFKTCKAPVFPPEIEAECAIAPDDPYALPEPRFMAEFASDPAIYERARRRHLEKIMWR
nr:DUF6708 domain-containing protein [Stenotrophomonas rhizophila]